MAVSGTAHKGSNPFLEANIMRYIIRVKEPYQMDYVKDKLSSFKNVQVLLTNEKRNYIVVKTDEGVIDYLKKITGVEIETEEEILHYTSE